MPARAFLLFGLIGDAEEASGERGSFNAREGIFAFRTTIPLDLVVVFFQSFNAREGIFAFRTPWRGCGRPWHYWFQCPRGHFCFSDPVAVAEEAGDVHYVSMPARAFLLFGLVWKVKRGRPKDGFNAREGIFAFRTNYCRCHPRRSANWFQCPRGHFCFSDITTE